MKGTNLPGRKTCICCTRELSGNKSREHVIPQWLLQEIGLEEETFYQKVIRKSDEQVVDKRQHAASAFVLGGVCTSCNNGWMSDLENRARPLLHSLIAGDRTVVGLNESERKLLSFWACKTAYAMSYAGLHKQPVPVDHFRHLDKHSVPITGVGVFAGDHTQSGIASIHQTQDWPHLHLDPNRGILIEKTKGYKLGLQLKRLLLLVCFSPDSRSRFVLAAGVHVPVWPIELMYPSYGCNKDLPEPQDSRAMLARFCATLAVLHRPPDPSRLLVPAGLVIR